MSHPEEDHLIPLMVVAGASENDVAVRTYHQNDFFGSATASSFRFDPNTPSELTTDTKEAAHV